MESDVMKRLAAPMVGGFFTAMLLTLVVVPIPGPLCDLALVDGTIQAGGC